MRKGIARRAAIIFGVAIAVLVGALVIWKRAVAAVELPPPREVVRASVSRADFVGAERCAGCHARQFAAWTRSTHGRAGGVPSPDLVIAPFQGAVIVFADARVTPRVRAGVYEFLVEQPGNPARVLRADGVIGGGHIYGGGTQGFVSRIDDGTLRFLPFEWSRQGRRWFCNTNSRSGRGWTPITADMRLEECGDWPPIRVIGDDARFANCQSCHASQATLALDSTTRTYSTQVASLAINCESCHGAGRRHVEMAERGTFASGGDIGIASLATLDKDASLRVCYQCHAVKDQLRAGFLSGDSLASFYSTKLPLLGERPLLPDGRTRTFAYQEGHSYSDCYLNGGMTCTSCHDPHDQTYRDVNGASLRGRFDDRQCTSCHAGIAANPTAHTKHPAAVACTSCHMPLRQEPETRATGGGGSARRASVVVPYTRSDHTISIPRPALDASFGLASACAGCHAGMSVAQQEAEIRRLWGEIKPLHPAVAAQIRVARGEASPDVILSEAKDLQLHRHGYAAFAVVSAYLESAVTPDAPIETEVAQRLAELSRSPDVDVRATALAALHLADGASRRTRRLLASALTSEGARDAELRARWATVLGYMGDRFATQGNAAGALTSYARALEVHPSNARLWLSTANTQRDAGDLASAVASYQRSLSLERNNPLAWVNYGIALGAIGDTASAITALTNGATLNPAEPLAWFNLGNIALVRGDFDRATALYGRTVSLEPSIALAHFQLARVNLLRHNKLDALANLRRGLAFDSSDASARDMARQLARELDGAASRR